MTVHNWMECYNITGEPGDDDPLEINITESEGMHVLDGVGTCEDTHYPTFHDLISFLKKRAGWNSPIGREKQVTKGVARSYWRLKKEVDLLHEMTSPGSDDMLEK